MHKNDDFSQSVKTAFNNKIIDAPVIVISSQMIMIKELTHVCIEKLTNIHTVNNANQMIWFFKESKIDRDSETIQEFDDSFVSYDCIKKFDLQEWCANKQSTPFGLFWKFYHGQCTPQEMTILNLWKKVHPLYENFRH